MHATVWLVGTHGPTQFRGESTATGFEYIFPAIRGVQAGREYYASMCPLSLIPKIFLFDEEELAPEVRAQRVLNKGRVPALARYIIDNPDDYVFSALTASVDGTMRFVSASGQGLGMRIGQLHVPMASRVLINDGQHRRAAIEAALRDNPSLGDETIAVVFFHDAGLERSQQMFADLNRHAVRPARSIGVLYDHRDELSKLTRLLALKSPALRGFVDMESSTLSGRSGKLFTLSALYYATTALLQDIDVSEKQAYDLAAGYWEAIDQLVPEWGLVRKRSLSAAEIRRQYLHTHGIALHALGRLGNTLLQESLDPEIWRPQLDPLGQVDWSRNNCDWEGRAIVGGRVSKSHQNVVLTVNYLRQHLSLELTTEEKQAEDAYLRGER
ncbi:DNA sulfur modification protein DndB [Streptosporangium sp. NBC_01469]|uniref:DNA sulfur modification protein DndB n=1 Tax=Streptosporangium sp. NBC_01469 TaxID=2903898 RepID=UPI002E2DCBFD|nr:DNA sulfur modification protein DndB [Streptosporangium sp. NBC_01469]